MRSVFKERRVLLQQTAVHGIESLQQIHEQQAREIKMVKRQRAASWSLRKLHPQLAKVAAPNNDSGLPDEGRSVIPGDLIQIDRTPSTSSNIVEGGVTVVAQPSPHVDPVSVAQNSIGMAGHAAAMSSMQQEAAIAFDKKWVRW